MTLSMTTRKLLSAVMVALVGMSGALSAQPAATAAQKKPASLGSVRIGSVMADGKALAAGTYSLRVSDEMPAKVLGQTLEESRWVEFVQGGQVKGRELATVLTKDALKDLTRKSAAPPAGTAKVQMLKGGDYVRVWVNSGGTNYLIHLGNK
jgi:hypothetical protein